jgi:hypothetical protein
MQGDGFGEFSHPGKLLARLSVAICLPADVRVAPSFPVMKFPDISPVTG